MVSLGADYQVTTEQTAKFWAAIEEACVLNESHRVLVEGYVPNRHELQASQIVDSGMQAAAVPRLWLALCLEDFEPDDLSELFKTIAATRGVHIKFFSDRDRAVNWLRTNSPA